MRYRVLALCCMAAACERPVINTLEEPPPPEPMVQPEPTPATLTPASPPTRSERQPAPTPPPPITCDDCCTKACGTVCEGPCEPIVLVRDQRGPLPIAVDDTGVYWANLAGHELKRLRPDGTEDLLVYGQTSHGVALDATHLWWTNFGAGTIERLQTRDAGMPEVFVTLPVTAGAPLPFRIALSADRVFWNNSGDGAVQSTLRAGGGVDTVMPGQFAGRDGGGPISASVFYPAAVATSAAGVYWSYTGLFVPPPYQPLMFSAAPTGSGSTVTGDGEITSVVAVGDAVYWTDILSGTVKGKTSAGAAPQQLATSLGPPLPVVLFDNDGYFTLTGIAADADFVYWIEAWNAPMPAGNELGRVLRVPRGGGPTKVLAQSPLFDSIRAGQIALDDRFIYWTNHREGTVNKLRKTVR